MDFRKKDLSKFLAIALMFACAAAFTPLLAGPAFAAKAKTVKPAKVEGLQLVQADIMTTPNEYDVTASWTKLKKNVAKYKIKIVDVTDPDAKPAPKFMTVKKKKKQAVFSGTVGSTYTVKVRAIKGKKKGPWSDPQTITIAEKRATFTGVTITMPRVGAVKIGDKLTAAVDPADVNVTWQWFRVKGDEEAAIDGAVSAEYTVQNADIGYFLKAVASVSEGNLTYAGSAEATTTVAVTSTSSGGNVEPTLEEYTEGILRGAGNYIYSDGYMYTARQAPNSVSIRGNTLTANYVCSVTLPNNPTEDDMWQATSQILEVNEGVKNDMARLFGGLYRSTNSNASGGPISEETGQPNDIGSDSSQNHIDRIGFDECDYGWRPDKNGKFLKGSNWRNLEEGSENSTLVADITKLFSETKLSYGVSFLPNKSEATIGTQNDTPEEEIPVGAVKESVDYDNHTFTESITVVAHDDKYPDGYPITLKSNIKFVDPLLFNFIIAPPPLD